MGAKKAKKRAQARAHLERVVEEVLAVEKSSDENSEGEAGEARAPGQAVRQVEVTPTVRYAVRVSTLGDKICTDPAEARAATHKSLAARSTENMIYEEICLGANPQGMYILHMPEVATPDTIAALLTYDSAKIGLDGAIVGAIVSNDVPLLDMLEDCKALVAHAASKGVTKHLQLHVEPNLFRTRVPDSEDKVAYAVNVSEKDLHVLVTEALAAKVKLRRLGVTGGSAGGGRITIRDGASRTSVEAMNLHVSMALWVGGFDEIDVDGPDSIGQAMIRKLTGVASIGGMRGVKRCDFEVQRFQLQVPATRTSDTRRQIKELIKATTDAGDIEYAGGGEAFQLYFAGSAKAAYAYWLERGGQANDGRAGGGGAAVDKALSKVVAIAEKNTEALEKLTEEAAKTPEYIKAAVQEHAQAVQATQQEAARATSKAQVEMAQSTAAAQVAAAQASAEAQIAAAQATADALAAEAQARLAAEAKQAALNAELVKAQAAAAASAQQAMDAQAESSRMAQQLMQAVGAQSQRVMRLEAGATIKVLGSVGDANCRCDASDEPGLVPAPATDARRTCECLTKPLTLQISQLACGPNVTCPAPEGPWTDGERDEYGGGRSDSTFVRYGIRVVGVWTVRRMQRYHGVRWAMARNTRRRK